MAHWFDDLAVAVGEESPRRTALKKATVGIGGALALLIFGGGIASANDDKNGDKDNRRKCVDPGLTRCGDTCAVVAIDPDNCGGCGIVCSGGAVCRNGKCVEQCPPVTCCPPGTTRCGGVCVATTTDQNNCGQCGHVCAAGQLCQGGTCACPSGTTSCNGACVSTATDPRNCGGCGVVCAAGSTCVNGACTTAQATCTDGIKNGTETDVDCGGSCPPCAAGKHCNSNGDCQSGVCSGGICSSCATGQTLCGNLCVDTMTSVTNCGACGSTCFTANGTSSCVNGQCRIASCNAGFADCNGNPADGCETNVFSDRNNCGACGNVCGIFQTCVNGACV